MATWSLLQNLTEFDFNSVCSDGEDVYFVQFGGGADYQVFKYDTSLDTITQISNAASFSGTTPKTVSMFPGGNVGSAIQFFGGNLYVGVFTVDATDMRVYRYDGAGTSWTEVLAVANPGGRWALYCTASHIIVGPTNEGSGAIPDSYLVTWAKYSADGSSWGAVTVSNSPAYISSGAGLSMTRGATTYGQGVSPVFVDSSDHNVAESDPDARYRWFEWSAGNLSITQSATFTGGAWSPADTWLRELGSYFRDVFHWSKDTGTVWKYVTTLGGAWLTPTGHLQQSAEIIPVTTIGFGSEEQCGDCNGDFSLMSGGTWQTFEDVNGVTGTAGITHVVKRSDGEAFLFAALLAQAIICGRSEPFPVVGSSRALYAYRTTDSGVNWDSRKVET